MASIDPLLHCPLCHSRLVNPTTLHCGHSLCSRHLEAPSSSSCPVPACSEKPATGPRIPSQSRVRYTPAQNPIVPAPVAIPDYRSDVVLNKIITLVDRALEAPPHPDSDDDDDDDTSSTSSRDSSHRPRKRRKQHHHHDDDDDDEPDLLSHLRSVAAQERTIPPDVPLIPFPPPPDPALQEFDKKLLDELTCHICYVLFYQPVTTPCQHVRTLLPKIPIPSANFHNRLTVQNASNAPSITAPLALYVGTNYPLTISKTSLSTRSSCPSVRPPLFSLPLTYPATVLKAYPLLYQERAQAIQEEERNARLNTPILVSNLSFPGVPTVLHLFEPRYRLMLRRCLETPHPRFGMIMSPKPGAPQINYGTILEIRTVQMLPDGRSLVETYGSARFRILERGTLDGYMVGRIERCPSLSLPLVTLSHPF